MASRTQQTPASTPRSHTVGVLTKAIDALEIITFQEPRTLRGIADAANLEKAAVYRILNTFESRGMVMRDADKRYLPGPQMLAMAAALLSSHDIVAEWLPTMNALRDEFQETVNLGMLDNDNIQYLAIVESPLSLRMTAEVGSTHLARSTALGKAIIATMDDIELSQLLGGRSPAAAALLDDIRTTRERGFAVDNEENERGAACVAVAIPDIVPTQKHAISISGPAARMTPQVVDRIGRRLHELIATRAPAD